jgi:hypothetical protein
MFAIADDRHAVDQHVFDAHRVLLRCIEGRLVRNGGGIEDDDVRVAVGV